MKEKIKVFITYAWESEEHKSKVKDFTNMLRGNGFEADMDRKVAQEKTAAHFGQMMATKIKESDKVIVVLSPAYKERAESYRGGVGREYRMIAEEINEPGYERKYILVTFQPRLQADSVPIAFKGNEVVNIYKDEPKFHRLFSKLIDQPEDEFVEVNNKLPKVAPRPSQVFTLRKEPAALRKPKDFNSLLQSIYSKIDNEPFFERYESEIKCRYRILNKKLVVEKQVKTKLVVSNPNDNFIEEAKFLNPYRFSRIKGIDDKKLIKLNRLSLKIDRQRKQNITKSVIIFREPGESPLYDETVKFRYLQLIDRHPNDLVFTFEDKLEIELSEARIVPRNDTLYIKRTHKLTKSFYLHYSFPDFDGELDGTCFSSLSTRDKLKIRSSRNKKSLTIHTDDWLLPGDGIFIVAKRNNFLP